MRTMARTDAGGAVAALDVGAGNFELGLGDPSGRVVSALRRAQKCRPAPPYRHLGVDAVGGWIVEGLRAAANVAAVAAIVTCTHGSAVVLVADTGPVLPPMAYDAEPPAAAPSARRASPS